MNKIIGLFCLIIILSIINIGQGVNPQNAYPPPPPKPIFPTVESKGKFLYSVTISVYEKNGKTFKRVTSQNSDLDAPPMSPWQMARLGLWLADFSLPIDNPNRK